MRLSVAFAPRGSHPNKEVGGTPLAGSCFGASDHGPLSFRRVGQSVDLPSRAGTTCTVCTAASAIAVPPNTRPHSQPDHHTEGVRQSGTSSLTGWTLAKDKTTGETLHHYTTANEPGGRLRVACGNRRASRCPSCAWTYAGDTYHLIRAGLAGDDRRDIPANVRDHPRVFATLTAPSFGPVHNRPDRGVCRCGIGHTTGETALATGA